MSISAVERYCAALGADELRIAEPPLASVAGNELELQARWFAGEFGREHVSADGEKIFVEDFGRWNHEAGPDFIRARVVVDGVPRPGAIELDLDVRDWERHGHATNPDFRGTALQLFVRQSERRSFTRTCDHRNVPQVQLFPEVRRPRATEGGDDPITRDGARARAILHAAARHRLARKAGALARHAAVHGEDEAWFAALAVALGYKRNQIPFSILAQRVTLPQARESLLFGVAGFLESPEPPAAGPEVRRYLRGLWEDWWAVRARRERWILPADAWHFGGLRPANHPHRRVAALAGIAKEWRAVHSALAGSDRLALPAALEKIGHPFWDHRWNLSAARLGRPHALIGAERIRDVQINVWFPLAAARDDRAWEEFRRERGPAPAAVLRAVAERFFGGLPAAELRRAAIQQGLLQVERDHGAAADPAAYRAALADFDPVLDDAGATD